MHFWFKFKSFYFCMNLCLSAKSRVLISNMTLVLSNVIPKTPKWGIFGSKFKVPFSWNFEYWKFWSAISKMSVIYSNIVPKTTEWGLFGAKFNNLFFIKHVCFVYIFSKFYPKNTKMRNALSKIWSYFFLSREYKKKRKICQCSNGKNNKTGITLNNITTTAGSSQVIKTPNYFFKKAFHRALILIFFSNASYLTTGIEQSIYKKCHHNISYVGNFIEIHHCHDLGSYGIMKK